MYQHPPNVCPCMCLFGGVEWWIAERYMEAECKSVLKWSRAERSRCCVWGSKPAVWIVCNGERGWDVFCLTHRIPQKYMPECSHSPLYTINHPSVYHSGVSLSAQRMLSYYTAPITPSQNSHLSQNLIFTADRSSTAVRRSSAVSALSFRKLSTIKHSYKVSRT